MVGPQQISFGEVALLFICQERSSFHSYRLSSVHLFLLLLLCGDPGLPIWNTRYAFNSWSHDQCVVNLHIRVDTRITSSITVPNNRLRIGHTTKLILPRRASLQLSSGYQAALMSHVMPTTLQATDWEMSLVRASVVVTIFIFHVVFFIVWPS
jgi:hypothetical protein